MTIPKAAILTKLEILRLHGVVSAAIYRKVIFVIHKLSIPGTDELGRVGELIAQYFSFLRAALTEFRP